MTSQTLIADTFQPRKVQHKQLSYHQGKPQLSFMYWACFSSWPTSKERAIKRHLSRAWELLGSRLLDVLSVQPRKEGLLWIFSKRVLSFGENLGSLSLWREPIGCIGEYWVFGHHVGDWERITVRFRKVNNDYRIYSIHLSTHGIDVTNKFGGEFLWQDGQFKKRDQTIAMYGGTHAVIYSSEGSHRM